MEPELVEETVALAGRMLALLRPASAVELIDEDAFDDDEFLPYWAELWPSGVALARVVSGLDLGGVRVLELGAGLGLPSLAAAIRGADVLATDWADDAVELLRPNAERNRRAPPAWRRRGGGWRGGRSRWARGGWPRGRPTRAATTASTRTSCTRARSSSMSPRRRASRLPTTRSRPTSRTGSCTSCPARVRTSS